MLPYRLYGIIDENKILNPPLNFQPFNQGQSISLTMISYEDHKFLNLFIPKILLHHANLPSNCVNVIVNQFQEAWKLTQEVIEFFFIYRNKIKWHQCDDPHAILWFINFCNQSKHQHKLISFHYDTHLLSCFQTFFNMLISNSDSNT